MGARHCILKSVNWSNMIDRGSCWRNRTDKNKTFKTRYKYEMSFPSLLPSILTSSPLWKWAHSTANMQLQLSVLVVISQWQVKQHCIKITGLLKKMQTQKGHTHSREREISLTLQSWFLNWISINRKDHISTTPVPVTEPGLFSALFEPYKPVHKTGSLMQSSGAMNRPSKSGWWQAAKSTLYLSTPREDKHLTT